MTSRYSAPFCLFTAAMIHCSCAKGGVWSMDPVLGITGDYATNPLLLAVSGTGEANGALLLDGPITYNADNYKFLVIPSFRVGDAGGYSSVASDYEHLNFKGEQDTERGVLSAAVGVARDSSLYQDYQLNGAQAVRRDNVSEDLNWDRFLTERTEFNADVNTSRVLYGESTVAQTLVDYRYTSFSATLVWQSSERNKVTLAASVGRYDSLDGTTESRNGNLQVGFIRQLSELWTVTATGGYSRALNRVDIEQAFLVFTPNGPAIEYVPYQEESSQNGAVYSVDLSRKGSTFVLDAIASRQVTPTGFAFLSRQDAYDLKGTLTLSDRWSFGAHLRNAISRNPDYEGQITTINLKYLGLAAYWRWTEQWTVSLNAAHIDQQFQSPNFKVDSTEVSITLSRQFNHFVFH